MYELVVHLTLSFYLNVKASTLKFLRDHEFKFGRLFADGIPTLRKSDEDRILEFMRMSADRYDFKNDEEKAVLEDIVKKVCYFLFYSTDIL